MRTKFLSGFTLIELMIVIAIIGLLAMFAVPSYQDYIMRTLVTDALSLSEQTKTAVTEYYLNFGEFPNNNVEAGLAEPEELNSSNVSQISVSADGLITINFRDQNIPENLRGTTLELQAKIQAGQIMWLCDGGSLDHKYRPANCRIK